jgi:hypothetical protein
MSNDKITRIPHDPAHGVGPRLKVEDETLDAAAARVLKAMQWGRGHRVQTTDDAIHSVATELVNIGAADWTDSVAAARRALALA